MTGCKPFLSRVLLGPSLTDDGISALQIAGAERFATISSPSLPSSGSVLLYGKSVSGQTALHMANSGGESALQSAMWKKSVAMVQGSYGSAGFSAFGMVNFSQIGTSTNRNYGNSSYLARAARSGKYSAASAGSFAAFYTAFQQYIVGDGSTLGTGFYCKFRFGVSDAAMVPGARMFVGLTMSTSAPTNVEPSTLINSIGVAQLSTDNTQLYLVYGGSAAQPPIPLGINFPVQEAPGSAGGGTLYDLHMLANRTDNRSITIQLDRVGTNYSYQITLSEPTAQVKLPFWAMGPQLWRCNNASALSVALDLCHFYVEVDL